jgi:sugar O-acyltransferase (sialic acid O-acetyltransferase NeuD family)
MRVKQRIILIGAGGHARSCVDVIENIGNYEIMGYVGTESEVGMFSLGYQVIGADKDLEEIRMSCDLALVAIGQIESALVRKKIYEYLQSLEFKAPTIISDNAYVSERAVIGAGTIVMPGAVIMPNVKVGANCIINSKALLEHDVVVGDNSHISTGVIINGGTTIENECFVGSGAVVREGVIIGQNSFIGMKSTVTSNIAANSRHMRI